MEIWQTLTEALGSVTVAFNEQIPDLYKPFVILAIYTIIIAIYSIFIWKFYKFLAKRNIIELNLSQYSRTEHPFLNKGVVTF